MGKTWLWIVLVGCCASVLLCIEFLFGSSPSVNQVWVSSSSSYDAAAAAAPPPPDHGRRLARHVDTDQNGMVLLGVGLPRTGSQFIHDFLTCHGIISMHYCCDATTADTMDNASVNHHQQQKQKQQQQQKDNTDTWSHEAINYSNTAFPCRQQTCGECIAQNLQQGRAPLHDCHKQQQQQQQQPYASSISLGTVAFSSIDVETSVPYSWFLPQHGALEAFVADSNNPPFATLPRKMIWILTQRSNATVWATSVLHWQSETDRLLHALAAPSSHNNHHDDKNNNNKKASLELPQGVTQQRLEQDLQLSIQRVHSKKEWERRRSVLERAYRDHMQHVRKTAAVHGVALIEVVVDNEETDPGQDLHLALQGHGVRLQPPPLTRPPSHTKNEKLPSSCWNFDAAVLDDDWRNFTFPF